MFRIRSGLLGNTEAIDDLGIEVKVAMLEVTDAFKQISNGRSWEQLTFYEQQQIRTLAILAQRSIVCVRIPDISFSFLPVQAKPLRRTDLWGLDC